MRILFALMVVVAGCGSDEDTPTIDAANADSALGPDAASDAPAGTGSVVCEEPTTECPLPGQVCCDVMMGMDTCIGATGACAGRPLACDGPEDCPGQECCLFEDRSECVATGLCGTTGAISEEMCHVEADCDVAAGETCCGTSPGPVLDLYFVCRVGGCPQ